MAQTILSKNLVDKRKEIQAHIGSLERDLDRARRDLSHIIATERVFQSRWPKVTVTYRPCFPGTNCPSSA